MSVSFEVIAVVLAAMSVSFDSIEVLLLAILVTFVAMSVSFDSIEVLLLAISINDDSVDLIEFVLSFASPVLLINPRSNKASLIEEENKLVVSSLTVTCFGSSEVSSLAKSSMFVFKSFWDESFAASWLEILLGNMVLGSRTTSSLECAGYVVSRIIVNKNNLNGSL